MLARLGSIAIAILSLIAGLEIWRLIGGPAGGSPLLYGALAVAAAGLLIGIALAVGPARWWRSALDTIRGFRSRVEAARAPEHRSAGVLLIVVAAVSWMAVEAAFLSVPRTPVGNDQAAYLEVAREVHAAGGPLALLRQLYAGEFPEANRHPLYIGLLSLRPTFEAGTVLSLAIGGVTLLVLSALVARTFGTMAGGLFAVLLATNFAFCHASSLVTCEALLVLWTGLAWLSVAGRGDKQPACHSGVPKLAACGHFRSAAAGALLGLAWLTKGTGLLLLAGFLLWQAVTFLLSEDAQSRPHFGRLRPITGPRLARLLTSVAVLLVAWAVVASPLLVRNIKRFGGPFYNVNSHLLFTDTFIHPEQLAEEMSLDEAASRYFETHTIGDMIARELRGLAWEAFIIVRTLGPAPLDDSRVLFGMPLLILAAIGLIAERRRDGLLLVIWLGLFWILFAWYVPIAAGDRFVLPVVVPVLAYAATGLARMAGLCRRLPPGRAAGWLIAGSVLWCLVWTAASWIWLA